MESSKQEMELSKQEMKLSYLLTTNQKNSLTKYLPFILRSLYPVLQPEYGIIQTRNGIISLISRPRIKKLLQLKLGLSLVKRSIFGLFPL